MEHLRRIRMKPGQLVKFKPPSHLDSGGWTCDPNGKVLPEGGNGDSRIPGWHRFGADEIGIFIKETTEHEFPGPVGYDPEPMHIVLYGETLVIVPDDLMEAV